MLNKSAPRRALYLLLSAVLLQSCATTQPICTAPVGLTARLKASGGSLAEPLTETDRFGVYCLADNQNNSAAQFWVGRQLAKTAQTPKDWAQVASYFRRAAKLKTDIMTIFIPGKNGTFGSNQLLRFPENDQPAIPAAQYELALLYRDGKGVPQDIIKVRKLMNDAAKAGHTAATEGLKTLTP